MNKHCRDCPLAERRPCVLGEGTGQRLIIIGEAPGRKERAKKRPFVGRSGQVLRGILRGLQVDPSDVRITNVVKCQPPDNRPPTRAEIQHCLPRLLEEIAAFPDARLLLLGNTALHTLTDCRNGITKARGEWFESKAWTEAGVSSREALATYHPAYIARPKGAKFFDTLVLDIQRALAGPTEFIETEHTILDTPQKVRVYFATLPQPCVVAWDLETSGYRAYQDYILAMSLSHEEGRGWVITEEMMHNEEVHAILRMAFEKDDSIRWVGHSAKFDQIFVLQHIGAYPKLWADTMMMHLALDERKGTHDLKVLSRDLCGAPDWESILWQYLENREDTYAKVPRDVLYKYAAFDADYTLRLFNIFSAQLDEEDVRRLHDELLLPASEAMMIAEYGGVSVDIDEVDEWQWKLEQELDDDVITLAAEAAEVTRKEIDRRLHNIGFSRELFWRISVKGLSIGWSKKRNRYVVETNLAKLNIPPELAPLLAWRAKLIDSPFSAGSWQKVGTLVYEILGLEYLTGRDVRTRGQEYSTSSASLEPYAQDYPIINAILAYRTKRKLKATYVDGLHPDVEGRVHPRWKMHATVTGRIGCIDPNVMNIPHEAGTRDFFIASPDHVLVAADYSQAELRILAAYSAQRLSEVDAYNAFLVKCYREGRDLHTEVTEMLFGSEWGYDERMIAKAYNFGLVYGRTAKSIAEAFSIPLAEAQAHKDAFFERMPEVKAFLEELEHAVVDPGYLRNAFGRKRRFSYVDTFNIGDLERQAKNFMMQSTASDCTLMSTVRISSWFRSLGWGKVLVFLHDSVMVEVPECAMKITARRMQEIMQQVPREYLGDLVPLKVDVTVGYGWGSMYDYDPVKGEIL